MCDSSVMSTVPLGPQSSARFMGSCPSSMRVSAIDQLCTIDSDLFYTSHAAFPLSKCSSCVHAPGSHASPPLASAQGGEDVAAMLSAWGRWQAALAPGRGPSVAEALVGSLGGREGEKRVRALGFVGLLGGDRIWHTTVTALILPCMRAVDTTRPACRRGAARFLLTMQELLGR